MHSLIPSSKGGQELLPITVGCQKHHNSLDNLTLFWIIQLTLTPSLSSIILLLLHVSVKPLISVHDNIPNERFFACLPEAVIGLLKCGGVFKSIDGLKNFVIYENTKKSFKPIKYFMIRCFNHHSFIQSLLFLENKNLRVNKGVSFYPYFLLEAGVRILEYMLSYPM